MFIHHVFFWLKEDADHAAFKAGLDALIKSPMVKEAYLGVAAKSDREVVEDSFDFSLLVFFETKEKHDIYQTTDEVHQVFIDTCKDMWTKVQVFDAI